MEGEQEKKNKCIGKLQSYKVQFKFQTLPNAQGFESLKFSFKFII